MKLKAKMEMVSTMAKTRAASIVSKSKFLTEEKAESGKVIEFAITIIIVAAMIPAALAAIFGANTSA